MLDEYLGHGSTTMSKDISNRSENYAHTIGLRRVSIQLGSFKKSKSTIDAFSKKPWDIKILSCSNWEARIVSWGALSRIHKLTSGWRRICVRYVSEFLAPDPHKIIQETGWLLITTTLRFKGNMPCAKP